MRKRDYGLCENKGADQLRSNCEADQRLCFRYSDSTISPLPICKISSFYPASVAAQTGLCQTRSGTPKTRFLMERLKFNCINSSSLFSYFAEGQTISIKDIILIYSEILHFMTRSPHSPITYLQQYRGQCQFLGRLCLLYFGVITTSLLHVYPKPGPEVIKLFFMLSSAETKSYPAHKC